MTAPGVPAHAVGAVREDNLLQSLPTETAQPSHALVTCQPFTFLITKVMPRVSPTTSTPPIRGSQPLPHNNESTTNAKTKSVGDTNEDKVTSILKKKKEK